MASGDRKREGEGARARAWGRSQRLAGAGFTAKVRLIRPNEITATLGAPLVYLFLLPAKGTHDMELESGMTKPEESGSSALLLAEGPRDLGRLGGRPGLVGGEGGLGWGWEEMLNLAKLWEGRKDRRAGRIGTDFHE